MLAIIVVITFKPIPFLLQYAFVNKQKISINIFHRGGQISVIKIVITKRQIESIYTTIVTETQQAYA